MIRYITCEHEQGTEGWHQDRLGMVTGSACSAVFAQIKTGEASTRADLRMDLLLERITGKSQSSGFKSADMDWGTEQEPHARMAYEMKFERDITEAGFLYLPNLKAGCSLDGFITDGANTGIYEAKCPKSKTHLGYLDAGVLPSTYNHQVTHNLWITGADFCDFSSFDPRMPEELQQFHIRVWRDEAKIRAHEAGVRQFLLELDGAEAKMRARIALIRAAKKQSVPA
jgi:hypothetical protein